MIFIEAVGANLKSPPALHYRRLRGIGQHCDFTHLHRVSVIRAIPLVLFPEPSALVAMISIEHGMLYQYTYHIGSCSPLFVG